MSESVRPIEDGIVTDFRERMSYGGYLDLDRLLSAQNPLSSPEHHDELLFIIQHQTTELWLKLVRHELVSARSLLAADDLRTALKRVARVKHIQEVMIQQWSVLATLTPSEYGQFRGDLGSSSGFQSAQYRIVEFMLGNKNRRMLAVFDADPTSREALGAELEAPSLYDEFLRLLARRGFDVPTHILQRDVTEPYSVNTDLVPVFREIYADPTTHWDLYEACEELVDIEDNFQLWRFRHMRTVMRTIGFTPGTGGSSGVDFLQRALSLTFFPELYRVRTELGA